MKLKKVLIGAIIAAVLTVFLSSAYGQKPKDAGKAAGKDSPSVITLQGFIFASGTTESLSIGGKAVEKKRKFYAINDQSVSPYEIELPEIKAKPGEKQVDMKSLIGKKVKIVAQVAYETIEDQKIIKVKSIKSIEPIIEKEEAAPPTIPAAAAPTTPAAP